MASKIVPMIVEYQPNILGTENELREHLKLLTQSLITATELTQSQ